MTADEAYGRDSKFRNLLVNKGIGYVVAVSCQQRLFLNGSYDRVDGHAQEISQRKWKKLSCGAGTKGQRFYQWAFVPFGIPTDKGFRKGLLVRRCLKNPEELTYYFTHAPKGTTLAKLVRIAGSRWAIEECFEQAQQETGLDEYEVRSWTGWHRHITLSMFAQAFLSVMRTKSDAQSRKKKEPCCRPDSSHRSGSTPPDLPTGLVPAKSSTQSSGLVQLAKSLQAYGSP